MLHCLRLNLNRPHRQQETIILFVTKKMHLWNLIITLLLSIIYIISLWLNPVADVPHTMFRQLMLEVIFLSVFYSFLFAIIPIPHLHFVILSKLFIKHKPETDKACAPNSADSKASSRLCCILVSCVQIRIPVWSPSAGLPYLWNDLKHTIK